MLSLNQLETQILLDLFKMEYEHGEEPKKKNYFEEGADWQEHCKQVSFSVIKLKKLGYINYDEKKTFLTGGMIDKKYHHNVLTIWWDRIALTPKGIGYVKEARKTLWQKAKEIGKKTGIDIAIAVKEEVKDLMAKALAEYFKGG